MNALASSAEPRYHHLYLSPCEERGHYFARFLQVLMGQYPQKMAPLERLRALYQPIPYAFLAFGHWELRGLYLEYDISGIPEMEGISRGWTAARDLRDGLMRGGCDLPRKISPNPALAAALEAWAGGLGIAHCPWAYTTALRALHAAQGGPGQAEAGDITESLALLAAAFAGTRESTQMIYFKPDVPEVGTLAQFLQREGDISEADIRNNPEAVRERAERALEVWIGRVREASQARKLNRQPNWRGLDKRLKWMGMNVVEGLEAADIAERLGTRDAGTVEKAILEMRARTGLRRGKGRPKKGV